MQVAGRCDVASRSLKGSRGRRARERLEGLAAPRTPALAKSLVLAATLICVATPLAAQTTEDLRAASRRLREVQFALEPLPDSGITRDADQIAIIEHDGSNYDDRLEDGTLNYEARTRVGLRFFETHGDDYDFLVVFTNFDFHTSDATAFHLYGRNDVAGIGKPLGSAAPVVFGSPARLKGWIDMAAVAQYRAQPFSLTPGELGFLRTLNVLAHEAGHQWLAEARFVDGGQVSDGLLGRDGNHWSYLLDSDASLLYGADWRDDGSGAFTALRVKDRYSALDLYLMGFLPPEKVGPVTLLSNPAVDPQRINREGEVVSGAATTVLVEQLAAAMGPRQPDARHSQKEYRLGFVFLTAPGTEPSPEDLAAVERVRRAFGPHFFALTHGVAWADTSLAVVPPAPRAAIPDLGRAVSWLLAQQALDGSWADAPGTSLRDTAAVVQALARSGASGPAPQHGLLWLQQAQSESLDFTARREAALAALQSGGAGRAARAAALLARQNPDGGLGAGLDFASDALDTALALRALGALGHSADAGVHAAVGALQALANPDGGWPAVPGGETSTVVTAEVLLALLDWPDAPGASGLQASGLAALLARRNDDGGFGASPSTPFASALALEVLLRTGGPADLVEPLVAWLRQTQLADGSWAGSSFQTALVLRALSDSLGANLTVPADALLLSPNPALEGDVVTVSALVRNAGRAEAPASVARLFDGDPGSSLPVAEAAVPALASGHEAAVSFAFPTTDRPGSRTLFVVADAGEQVPESREDDNATSRSLNVEGLLADLVITPASIAVVPAVPEIGEDAVVTVTVANVGERASSELVLDLSATDPDGRMTLFSETIPALAAGETTAVAFPWTPTSVGTHVLRAVADARYQVPERDETNGEAVAAVQVLDEAPAGVELAIREVELAPDTLRELPQAVELRIHVENAGRSPAATTIVVRDPLEGDVVLPLELGPREARVVTTSLPIGTPWDRELEVVVDPDGLIPEADEGNNAAFAFLSMDRTWDAEVTTGSLSSADVEQGEVVHVTVELRNRGTVDLLELPVLLAHEVADGPVELSRTTVDLMAGESTTVDLSWRATIVGDAVPLLVQADPFDLLQERREDNNVARLALRVRPSGLPNLTAAGSGVRIDPDPPVEGESAVVTAQVRNTGAAPAESFVVSFFVGDPDEGGNEIGQATLGGLEPGDEQEVQIGWAPVTVRGSLGLFAIVDAAGTVEESDEDDNVAFRPFQSLGRPDLVLAAADVVLDPAFPREGELVTIQATVRNQGGQPSIETTLRVVEGEPAGDLVGALAVPPLAPGTAAGLSLTWTPSVATGDRPLRLAVDPDDLVTEQDEGNNTVRKVVVIQDGDFHLAAPFFSPNGDGVLDESTLAWRANVPVSVVVFDGHGAPVRTLAVDAPQSGSSTWDGRDERGRVAWDGSYTIRLSGEEGALLGETQVVLDTNRSPLHDINGPADTAIRNVTCSLPDDVTDLAWTPGEDALYAIVQHARDGFLPGILRLDLGGDFAYVSQDPWYSGASFVSEAAVSPDGREVLVLRSFGLYAVDLATGERRSLGSDARRGRWSPDSRWIQAGDEVLSRAGALVASLPYGDWAWSPGSDRLALGGTVVARDGTVLLQLPLAPDYWWEEAYADWTTWRGDGRIATGTDWCLEADVAPGADVGVAGDDCTEWHVVDPARKTATPIPVASWREPFWSPDGRRYITNNGYLFEEDGTFLAPLPVSGPDAYLTVSPRASAALYGHGGGTSLPGAVCGDKSSDTFALVNVANLAAELNVGRLPGNAGLVLRGLATDRHLERFELDWARADDPGTWHPIGAASEVPVVDDTFAVWVPEGPGTYLVRLRVQDRAGNVKVRTRTVAWDRLPSIANFTQSGYFVSPDGNGVKDEVVFRYTVVEPTRLDVRVVGPEPQGPEEPTAGEVRRWTFEYPNPGPESLTWDGRDESGQIAPDGRYTVFLNDLPFRVEVDTTPPEIDFRFENARAGPWTYQAHDYPVCLVVNEDVDPPAVPVALGKVLGDRVWHVVDPHLEAWALRAEGRAVRSGSDPVYVSETGATGEPRVRREAGRPVGRTDTVEILSFAWYSGFTFQAEDHAGNRSEVAVAPVAEAAWALGAEHECDTLMPAPVDAEGAAVPPRSYGLAPENVLFAADTSARPPDGSSQALRLAVQPREGGPWQDLPLRRGQLEIKSFEERGVDPTRTWRGRFVARGSTGDVASDDFLFDPCPQLIRAEVKGGVLLVEHRLDEPVMEAWARLERDKPGDQGGKELLGRYRMAPLPGEPDRFFLALPEHSCDRPLQFAVEVIGASGRTYPDHDIPGACQRVSGKTPPECRFALGFSQEFPGCGGSPDELHLDIRYLAELPARIEIEGGPEEEPTPITAFDVAGAPAFQEISEVVDVAGAQEGPFAVRVRVIPADPGLIGVEAEESLLIDRTPPVGEVLVPPEGGSVCLADGPSGVTTLSVLARAADVSSKVDVTGFAQSSGGARRPLSLACPDENCESLLPSGTVLDLAWDATFLDSGEYDLGLEFCDRSGNVGLATRHVFVTREAPDLEVTSTTSRVFSPNADGRVDATTIVARLAQASRLSARAHAGSAEGPPVRTLLADQPFGATDVTVTWDGRADDGTVLPDGPYAVVFSIGDACGGTGAASTTVEIDTIPPETAIDTPSGGQRVSASVEILGQATDSHLESWGLDVSCGGTGGWAGLASGTRSVPSGSFVDFWDTSSAPPGECQLRLVAEDEGENRSPEALASVLVERGELIERLLATPDVFSPNGDGRRETASLEYTLARAARVRLEVRTGSDIVRTLESDALHPYGPVSHVWDGRDDTGALAPDGQYVLWMRAEDPDVATVYEEATVRLILDTQPPLLTVTRPVPGALVPSQTAVRGSVEDANLLEYVVTATPAGGPPTELGRGNRTQQDASLAPLGNLDDGPHTLRIDASDLAENTSELEHPFVLDSVPPRAAIQGPSDGSVLRRGEEPIAVTGLVGDAHLEGWTLRFGPAGDTGSLGTLAEGTAGGNGMPLAAWDVRFLPDGVYVLGLTATDLAGLSTESRITVTLDGRPPDVAITTPTDGGYVTRATSIYGTAADEHLASWTLDVAPGDSAAAWQWTTLGSGVAPVSAGLLAPWSPLPADGVYTLRVRAEDEVGQAATSQVTVTVDATPPSLPTGLEARVRPGEEPGYGVVVLSWDPNTEPDLAGYRVYGDRGPTTPDLLDEPGWNDGERVEGTHLYTVLAVDEAGNWSPPARVEVLVDLTPPTLAFLSPGAGAAVSGLLEVKGTAWSTDDFAEYRLLVGEGETPTTWSLLQRSTLPVAAGHLGDWLALADGPHVLALEAEDTRGNEGRITRLVTVDTQPPEPPVLVRVDHEPPPVDRLVPVWQPSPSGDVDGYLVYRNGRLANAGALVLGDLQGFLVPGPSIEDDDLPDGEHCYTVVAMDEAGNTSVPSEEICRSLDNRAPQAVIVQPADGTRFGYPLRVAAETPDLDVAIVRFERREAGSLEWLLVGERVEAPWEITLDPEGLALGEHELRAVATDDAGNTDPAAAAITVVHGDTTPPPPPAALVARVDGADVALTWAPPEATDLAGYRVYRDGERIAEDVTEPAFLDAGLATESYSYTVTAVDDDANESTPSAPAPAVVYALRLEPPAWPVLAVPLATVVGEGSRPDTTVALQREGATVAETPGTGGPFVFEGVSLVPDGNVLAARGADVAGNRSLPSNEIVLIANTPPAPVSALEAAVDTSAVSLTWAPVVDTGPLGYVVRRDGELLTASLPQGEATSVSGSLSPETAGLAFDGNPSTAWPDVPAPAQWRVVFPSPVLVERVHLRFAVASGLETGPPADYTISARWQGRDVPLVKVRGNAAPIVSHLLPSAFATDALAVTLDSPGQVAEVQVFRLDIVPAGTETFFDDPVPDGRHAYAVSSIDPYGAEGPAASLETDVGDVDSPGSPTGLEATPDGRDAVLVWDPSPEPDVVEYGVLRDGARIDTSTTASYRDTGLPNGTYVYTVTAVDAADHESEESLPDEVTIDLAPSPPASPVILEPTDAANPITVQWSPVDVAGRADAGSIVSLEVNGEPRGATAAAPGFSLSSETALGWDGDVALSADGTRAAWGQHSTTVSVKDLSNGEVRLLTHGGDGGSYTHRFSPDGSALALARRVLVFGVGYEVDVVRLDLADGTLQELVEGDPVDLAWSSDGTLLALSLRESDGTSVHVVQIETGAITELHRSAGTDVHLRWSPEQARLAFIRSWSPSVAELRLLDVATGAMSVLDEQAWAGAPPSWSADRRLLAWTTAAAEYQRIRVLDTGTGEEATGISAPGSHVRDPRFAPSGDWLSFARATSLPEGWDLMEVVARHESTGIVVPVTEFDDGDVPDVHEWLGTDLAVVNIGWLEKHAPVPGRFVLRDVPLVSGENRLVARAADLDTGLSSDDSEAVLVTVPDDVFPNLVVEASGVSAAPPVLVARSPGQLQVRVDNQGSSSADGTSLLVTFVDPDGVVVSDLRADVPDLSAGQSARIFVPWTPERAGPHTVRVVVDPDGTVDERREDDNAAERAFVVAEDDALAVALSSDRSRYSAHDTAVVALNLANAGPPFRGIVRTVVEDAGGSQVALLGEIVVDLGYGHDASWTLEWTTGTTWAGEYRFRVLACPEGSGDPAECVSAERPFTLEADQRLSVAVRPEPALVSAGAPVVFALRVDNQAVNAPLEGATLRLQVRLEGATGPVLFETARLLPTLPPGTTWQDADIWALAEPPGRHAVSLVVEKPEGASIAGATTVLTVGPGATRVVGTLDVEPGDVLLGQAAQARAVVTNEGTVPAAAYPIAVEVVSGPEPTVLASVPSSVDLAPGETREVLLEIETGGLSPAAYAVLLRGGDPVTSLDRGTLDVHAPLGAPSPHAPAEGERVATAHPALTVNNASGAGTALPVYEFQVFGDAALTQVLPGASGVAETPERTSWRVTAALAEDTTYWWRARASDGFSTSPWSSVASFTVDTENRPPGTPVPDTPAPGSTVASLQPGLTVRNAADPEGDPLVYDFRLAADPEMGDVVASVTDVAEGLGLTSWMLPVALEEDALYHWTARARDTAGASSWAEPVSFRVETVNEAPTPPTPLAPVDGEDVATITPALVVANASDPEGDPLVYRFEIDREATFDSPERQISPEVPEGAGETSWAPLDPLVENTTWFWRAFASDGRSETSSVVASFFVNVANDPPGRPVLLDPVDGQVVGTSTPTLRLRNTADPEDDPLTYAFEVRDATGVVVAQSPPVPAGDGETSWTVPDSLDEDADFTWTARASDGDLDGPWSVSAAFRIDAVQEPPTAPLPLLPADRATVDETRPTLVVENATSPEGLALVYSFELSVVTVDGAALVAEAHDIPEEPETTAWTPSIELAEGAYEWRARASDPVQGGPWSATSRFEVRLDPPPAAPTGLQATPGDARVRLDWNASPEPDVTGYHVYRATTPGGPYDLVGSVTVPAFDDTGLTNGVVYHYIVTATDARNESLPSSEAAARPEEPLVLVVEVRHEPSRLSAECLVARGREHRAGVRADRRATLRPSATLDQEATAQLRSDRDLIDVARLAEEAARGRGRTAGPQCHWPPRPGPGCPVWIRATIELPAGHDPESIDVRSLRLLGVASPDPGYRKIVDSDRDGLLELRVRFRLSAVAPHLTVGVNHVTITGRAGASDLQGTSVIEVTPLRAGLRVSPRTLWHRSCGHDVLAVVTFARGMPAREVEASTIRLNETVPVKRVLWAPGRVLFLKFDRAAVLGVLPAGKRVEVRVTGTLHGLPFEAVDRVRVIQ